MFLRMKRIRGFFMVAKNISIDDGLLTLLRIRGSSCLKLSEVLPYFFKTGLINFQINLLNDLKLRISRNEQTVFEGVSDVYFSGEMDGLGSYLMFHIDHGENGALKRVSRAAKYRFELGELLTFESRLSSFSTFSSKSEEKKEYTKLVISTSGTVAVVSPLFFDTIKLDVN